MTRRNFFGILAAALAWRPAAAAMPSLEPWKMFFLSRAGLHVWRPDRAAWVDDDGCGLLRRGPNDADAFTATIRLTGPELRATPQTGPGAFHRAPITGVPVPAAMYAHIERLQSGLDLAPVARDPWEDDDDDEDY